MTSGQVKPGLLMAVEVSQMMLQRMQVAGGVFTMREAFVKSGFGFPKACEYGNANLPNAATPTRGSEDGDGTDCGTAFGTHEAPAQDSRLPEHQLASLGAERGRTADIARLACPRQAGTSGQRDGWGSACLIQGPFGTREG